MTASGSQGDVHLQIVVMEFHRASQQHRRAGLLGWIMLCINGTFILDAITLRRSLEGRLYLSYPEHRDGAGIKRPYIRPVDAEVGRQIERQVLPQLRQLSKESAR